MNIMKDLNLAWVSIGIMFPIHKDLTNSYAITYKYECLTCSFTTYYRYVANNKTNIKFTTSHSIRDVNVSHPRMWLSPRNVPLRSLFYS